MGSGRRNRYSAVVIAALLATWPLLASPAPFSAGAASEPEPCRVHIILFTPADVAPPKAYQERISQMVDYSEAFLRHWLNKWGHEDAVMPFIRSAGGQVEVRLFQGEQPAAQYTPVAVRAEVMDALRAEGRINQQKQVWWIMVYAGDPPARFEGFLGGVGNDIGGWAVCNFDTTPGRINPAEPLGSDFLAKLMLKGMLHELGHGLGLPHVGPLQRDRAGNNLMGPTHINWRRIRGEGEKRVYLTEAEAAILAQHPAFRGVPDERGTLPSLTVTDIKCAGNPRQGTMVLRGRVKASERAVLALVADESEERPGEYWTKTYVGKVEKDGTFKVLVSEAARCAGNLRIWFVFEDGDHTGDGRRRSRPSGFAVPYTYGEGRWTFSTPAGSSAND